MTVLIQPYATPNRVGVVQVNSDKTFGHHLCLISECCGEDVVWDMGHSDVTALLWMCEECQARVVNGARTSAQPLTGASTDLLLDWVALATGLERSCLTATIDWK